MNILVLGGTRYFGIPMVEELLRQGHEVTLATRQITQDKFGDAVKRIQVERTDQASMKEAFQGKYYDVVYDKIAYCSNDIKYAMDAVECGKYIFMSSTFVYLSKQKEVKEEDFDGVNGELVWCSRFDFPYAQIKRQAEYALWQEYKDKKWLAVRYPFVIGQDDYTERLLFYVQHTMKGLPMQIDNLDAQMGFMGSEEAGRFLAFLADKDITGAINGSSNGTISLREIIGYVEEKTGKKAIISADGEEAPYNGEPEYSICTEKAKALGFDFSDLKEWIFDLLDYYIALVKATQQ